MGRMHIPAAVVGGYKGVRKLLAVFADGFGETDAYLGAMQDEAYLRSLPGRSALCVRGAIDRRVLGRPRRDSHNGGSVNRAKARSYRLSSIGAVLALLLAPFITRGRCR
jgi:hypothetical protein